ncbi:MAG: ABC transporter permease [Oscillospiraceae bacterium]
MNIITAALSQGLLWGIMVLGVYISYRILDFPDLTADGSIALGGAVSAICTVNGINPCLTLCLSLLAGAGAGAVTGFLHSVLQIPGILAGILTMISLYSVDIEILGRANISLLGESTVFTMLSQSLNINQTTASIIVGGITALSLVLLLNWFLATEIGELLRATGDNETMVLSQGKNPAAYKILGLSLSNGFIALAGGFIAQQQGYADVAMGTGSIVIGLASIIIGEVVFGKKKGFIYKFTSVIIGSIIYRLIIAFVLFMGLKPTMLNLFTALIVAAALSSPAVKKKIKTSQNKKR